MPKLPVVSPQKLAKALESAGFELMRVREAITMIIILEQKKSL
jgi:hypothetical protein